MRAPAAHYRRNTNTFEESIMAKTAAQVAAEKATADAELAQAAAAEAAATADATAEDKPKGYNQATGEFVL